MTYPIRVVPWWTGEASRFLSNVCKWYPTVLNRQITALEVGSGNSTFYLLSKGVKVTSIESDSGYAAHVQGVAEAAGYSVKAVESLDKVSSDYDLNLVKAPAYVNKNHKPGFWYDALRVEEMTLSHDLLINDGVDRLSFMEKFHQCKESIVILDNCEYAANWGRLMKTSAKPALAREYRNFLRDKDWNRIIFEQPEGREGRGASDAVGWESNHRWATAIAWRQEHLFSQLMVSNLGFPLTNEGSVDDMDLNDLEARCPFDWDTMEWGMRDDYPATLDLKLTRHFD